jgi:hypothetical protein
MSAKLRAGPVTRRSTDWRLRRTKPYSLVMSRRARITALVTIALVLSNSASAQPGARLLRVEGPIETYDIDGDVGFVGEYHVLRPGRHSLTLTGEHHGRLTVTLNVGSFGVRMAGTSVSDACVSEPAGEAGSTEVRSWPVQLTPDRQANGATVLVVREAKPEPRARTLSTCTTPRWNRQATWKLNVTSTPAGASIAAGERYLAATDARLTIPYGASDSGGSDEEVHLRVYKPGFIGCTFLLGDLRKQQSNDVNCDLVSPVPAATRPSRP